VRSCSCAAFCPIETSTTSVPLTFSFRRSPSSIAISSKGLITHLTLSVVMPTPSGAIFTTVSGSGTRLTATRIFTLRISLAAAVPRQGRSLHSAASLSQSNGDRAAGSTLCFSPSEVEAETAGELATRLQDQRGDLLLDALVGEPRGGRGHGEGADDVAGVVTHGHRDRPDVLHVLAHVDCIAAGRDRAELLEDRLAIDQGTIREALQAVGQERAELVLGFEGEIGLARRAGVERQRLPQLGDDAHGPIGFDDLDRHDAGASEHRDIGSLPHLAHELPHDRTRLAQESHVLDVALSQLETADPQAVVLGRAVLLDVATRLERGEEAEDVVLVELQPLRELGDPELLGLPAELLEDVQAVGARLNDVIGFLSADHEIGKSRFRLCRGMEGVNAGSTLPRPRNTWAI